MFKVLGRTFETWVVFDVYKSKVYGERNARCFVLSRSEPWPCIYMIPSVLNRTT